MRHRFIALTLGLLLATHGARADDDAPTRPYSLGLRNVGIVAVPVSAGVSILGVGLLLQSQSICLLLTCSHAEPELHAPGAFFLASGLVGIPLGVIAILVGRHRVPSRSFAVAPTANGLSVTF